MWQAIYHEIQRWAKTSSPVAATNKKTEITVATEQVWIIRRSRTSRGWCAECGREVDMVDLKKAEALSGMTQPMLPQTRMTQPMLPGCGEGGRGWHWSRASDGSPLVCLESLLKSR
jgi:hypothetical protein